MAPTCLITGSTGIGAATARVLAAKGWQIFICSRTRENCVQLAEELGALGAAAGYFAADLSQPESASEMVRACVESFGRLDALYNVAGISGRKFGDGPPLECTDQGWDTVLGTNAGSQFRMCREALAQMLRQEPDARGDRGVVLNMSSILGNDPLPSLFNATAYASSKGAIQAMTRHLAATFAKDRIRVNAIAPGLVATRMSARASEDAAIVARMREKQPLTDGLIPVEDVAEASAFLLSPHSRAITGQVLMVDGGWNVC